MCELSIDKRIRSIVTRCHYSIQGRNLRSNVGYVVEEGANFVRIDMLSLSKTYYGWPFPSGPMITSSVTTWSGSGRRGILSNGTRVASSKSLNSSTKAGVGRGFASSYTSQPVTFQLRPLGTLSNKVYGGLVGDREVLERHTVSMLETKA